MPPYKIIVSHFQENCENGEFNKFQFKISPKVEEFILGGGLLCHVEGAPRRTSREISEDQGRIAHKGNACLHNPRELK